MTETLVWADEPVRKIVQQFLWTHHARLADKAIALAFTDKKIPAKLTCRAYATIGICTPRERLLAAGLEYRQRPVDVLIVLNHALWVSLEPSQQVAVVDHTLEHVWLNEDDELSLREHEISEFAVVIERNGLYLESMRHAARVIRQLGAEALG